MTLLTIDKTVENNETKTNQKIENKIKNTKRLNKLEKRLGLISNKLGLSYAIYTK
ncbi:MULTISPECIES: hypothetical protein [unclassified Moritella]|uniref:hypothetical protein n=1 Tax=unclassified Moritella TaxID=2637987 RepID=UPI001BAC8B49|nr:MULTISPECIES: hypothetical protein [unclassified Moritella]QUM80355.1 hypothetical protein HWV01_08680 [Moritella sp. 5]QUM84629.1 hypothetical protein HWV02_08990 [Moritella sp. 28]